MTYVDRVAAPVLLIAGSTTAAADRPGDGLRDALRRRGHPVEVHTYPEGHHASERRSASPTPR